MYAVGITGRPTEHGKQSLAKATEFNRGMKSNKANEVLRDISTGFFHACN
jgi:hypothetical protein